jgi:hypothetical protein
MEFDHVVNHHFDLPLVLPVAINGNAKVSPRQPCLRAALDPDADVRFDGATQWSANGIRLIPMA